MRSVQIVDLDPDISVPLWRQLADELDHRIRTGQYPAGRRLPSESDLMAEGGCSRGTVRKALTELATRGLTETVAGKGTYVMTELPK